MSFTYFIVINTFNNIHKIIIYYMFNADNKGWDIDDS